MIRIYSFTAGPAAFLDYQNATFRSFLSDTFELIVINDGQDESSAGAIERTAGALGLRCERVPFPPQGDPSIGLASAMGFALTEFARYDDDASFFVHGDLFACRRVSLRELLEGADVVGHPELKTSADGLRSIYYPWSGFVGLRIPSLASPETIRFDPGEVEGVRCDTGGMFAHYAADHPKLRLRALEKMPVAEHAGTAGLLPEAEPPLLAGSGIEFVAGVLLHYLSGSGWRDDDGPIRSAKQSSAFALLDRLLDGELTLSRFDATGTHPWPESAP